MNKYNFVITVVLVAATLLIVSCVRLTPETAPHLPAASPQNEAPIAVPAPVPPPGMPGGTSPIPPTGRENVHSIQINLVPSKLIYLPGEPVQMQLILTNASQRKVETIIVSPLPPSISLVPSGLFSGPARPPDITTGPGLESNSSVKTFPAGALEKKLAMGEKVTYDLGWDQKDKDGKQVSPGWYYYESTCYFRPESSKDSVGSGAKQISFVITKIGDWQGLWEFKVPLD